MLITFSPSYSAAHDPLGLGQYVEGCAHAQGASAVVTWTKRQQRGQVQVRFTLHDRVKVIPQPNGDLIPAIASPHAHDAVIAALFELDPEAEIRTAKAHFHGRDDFQRQVKASTE